MRNVFTSRALFPPAGKSCPLQIPASTFSHCDPSEYKVVESKVNCPGLVSSIFYMSPWVKKNPTLLKWAALSQGAAEFMTYWIDNLAVWTRCVEAVTHLTHIWDRKMRTEVGHSRHSESKQEKAPSFTADQALTPPSKSWGLQCLIWWVWQGWLACGASDRQQTGDSLRRSSSNFLPLCLWSREHQ